MEADTKEDLLKATRELLEEMVAANRVAVEDIACVLFTTTQDLKAEFPAAAARQMGWSHIPLLCGHEMNVPGSLARCLRILLLYNTEKRQEEIVHIYTKGAKNLKSELKG